MVKRFWICDFRLWIVFFCLSLSPSPQPLAPALFAQQPQTNAPVFRVNATTANGVAPGYWPTAGAGLVLNLSAGSAICDNSAVSYAGGTLILAASSTNYVYLDPSNSCAPASNTTGFADGNLPVATVVTGASSITTITDSRTLFAGGRTSAKIAFAHRFAGGTCDAKIMAADVALGATAGEIWINQNCGLTITGAITPAANHVLKWIQGGTWVFSGAGKITMNFIGNSIIGPGSGDLTFDCSALLGDCVRWQMSPFTVVQAGKLSGVTIKGGAGASTVGLHLGDTIGATIEDVVIPGFTGTSGVGLWLDNVTNFTERLSIDRVHLDGNTKGLRFTNTGNVIATSSFAYNRIKDLRLNVNVNQTGISIEGGSLVNNPFWSVNANVGSATGTVLAISGVQYTGGPGTTLGVYSGSMTSECTGCTGGTSINKGAGTAIVWGGLINTTLTDTGTGTLTVNLPQSSSVASGAFNNTQVAGQNQTITPSSGYGNSGSASYLLTNTLAPGGFLTGLGINTYFDGANWKFPGDGVNSGGAAILGSNVSNDIEFFVVPNAGAATQSITPANLAANNKVATLNNAGTLTAKGQLVVQIGTGTAPLSVNSTTPVANLTASNHPTVFDCGTTSACAGTQQTAWKIYKGTAPLAGGTVTITGLSFTSATSYVCTANDQTATAAVGIGTKTATSVVLNGTGTDTVAYQCMGN